MVLAMRSNTATNGSWFVGTAIGKPPKRAEGAAAPGMETNDGASGDDVGCRLRDAVLGLPRGRP